MQSPEEVPGEKASHRLTDGATVWLLIRWPGLIIRDEPVMDMLREWEESISSGDVVNQYVFHDIVQVGTSRRVSFYCAHPTNISGAAASPAIDCLYLMTFCRSTRKGAN